MPGTHLYTYWLDTAHQIQKCYDKRLKELDEFIKNRDYEGALKVYNVKAKLLNYIANEIVDNYRDRILTHISSDVKLQKEIKLKYFPMIEK